MVANQKKQNHKKIYKAGKELTNAEGTSVSSSVFVSSISAAESQSMFSLFAAT